RPGGPMRSVPASPVCGRGGRGAVMALPSRRTARGGPAAAADPAPRRIWRRGGRPPQDAAPSPTCHDSARPSGPPRPAAPCTVRPAPTALSPLCPPRLAAPASTTPRTERSSCRLRDLNPLDELLCRRTSVTVMYQDIGDSAVALGGDTSGLRLREKQESARRSSRPFGDLSLARGRSERDRDQLLC